MDDSNRAETPPLATPTRRFGLGDAMILISAVAIGTALARTPVAFFLSRPAVNSADPPLRRLFEGIRGASMTLYPAMTSLTYATVVLGLRRPRPSFHRIFRRSGMIACAAATVGSLYVFLTWAPTLLQTWGGGNFAGMLYNVWSMTSRQCGDTVIGAWVALALGGRWRSERTWIDRMGRTIGAIWIGVVVLEAMTFWILYAGW